jgi:hypothetical protein
MPSSSQCPCLACFESDYPTQAEVQARTTAMRKHYVVSLPTRLPSFLSRSSNNKSATPSSLKRTDSIASSKANLALGAEPFAGSSR